MEWIIIGGLGVCVIALALRLFFLHSSIRRLAKEFNEIVQQPEEAQRHVTIASPDGPLENLAASMNEYISDTFETRYRQKKHEQQVRKEITNISHDLRTPLTSILGYLNLIESGTCSEEEIKQYFQVVKRRSKNLQELIQQLYDYSRLESDASILKPERVDLHHLFCEHILQYYTEFEQNGVAVDLRIPDYPIWIFADREGVERILNNLTSNTVKYGRNEVTILLMKAGKNVVLTYENEAGTLSEYDVAHLFDRFYRKDVARKSVPSSGLGLTIAKLLTEKMGGHMQASLKDGRLLIQCILPSSEE